MHFVGLTPHGKTGTRLDCPMRCNNCPARCCPKERRRSVAELNSSPEKVILAMGKLAAEVPCSFTSITAEVPCSSTGFAAETGYGDGVTVCNVNTTKKTHNYKTAWDIGDQACEESACEFSCSDGSQNFTTSNTTNNEGQFEAPRNLQLNWVITCLLKCSDPILKGCVFLLELSITLLKLSISSLELGTDFHTEFRTQLVLDQISKANVVASTSRNTRGETVWLGWRRWGKLNLS